MFAALIGTFHLEGVSASPSYGFDNVHTFQVNVNKIDFQPILLPLNAVLVCSIMQSVKRSKNAFRN